MENNIFSLCLAWQFMRIFLKKYFVFDTSHIRVSVFFSVSMGWKTMHLQDGSTTLLVEPAYKHTKADIKVKKK